MPIREPWHGYALRYECASSYCKMVQTQRSSSNPHGACDIMRVSGHACYKESGSISGNHEASKCAIKPLTGPQYTCTKTSTEKPYKGTVLGASAPAQPYTTFYGHYSSDHIDGVYESDTGTIAAAYDEAVTMLDEVQKSATSSGKFYHTSCNVDDSTTFTDIPGRMPALHPPAFQQPEGRWTSGHGIHSARDSFSAWALSCVGGPSLYLSTFRRISPSIGLTIATTESEEFVHYNPSFGPEYCLVDGIRS
ncbi:hypothetical protein K437DRAFT_263423 [Tilletiaria anomala UBC 951]|uniref:Uncharacterized protein n=1 Tax=Tilletiaria anomala (strain ATCC 24038 / CBS 436.72 / UBC 951) TaxID=1037660 RepID=A0A066VUI1_TILAU|nr:uncharacterized protein K437DRAFT_263423 [Tilletiaria anomala UBC 951]KDN43923.1 hypothetical protein K437DRAFT_263423 [Tilletiaria anomala UBC 951]